MKKIFLTSITIVALFTSSFLVQPQKAHAVDLDDPANILNVLFKGVTTGEDVWQGIAKEVLEPAVQAIADKMLSKLTQSVLTWASGGFDGDPSFINNWDDFLKGTEHEVISSAFTQASNKANEAQENSGNGDINQCIVNNGGIEPNICDDQYLNDFEGCIWGLDPVEDEELYEACENERDAREIEHFDCIDDWAIYNQIVENCENGDPGGTAQNNYNIWNSGAVTSTRSVASTIARSGSQRLNSDPLSSIIDGSGGTLITLLGSQSAKDEFKNDIRVGGWTGYLELGNPHNTEVGLNSIVSGALESKTDRQVTTTVQDVQTSQKFLDKKDCSNGGEIIDGACPIGEQLISTTPGAQVGNLVSTALNKDTDQAKNAKGLVGSLVTSLGKLTSGLIDQGINKISKVALESFYDSADDILFSNDNEFLEGGYQSDYDVLGIQSDSQYIDPDIITDIDDLFASQNGQGAFLGGPEDYNGNWGEGPQIIIDFNELLQSNMDLADQEYEYWKLMEQIIIDTKSSAVSLDQCLPGPDFKWEERWSDVMDMTDEANLGLTLTKKMVKDPRVNIPGSKHLSSSLSTLIGTTKSEAIRIRIRLEDLDRVRSTLSFIHAEIEGTFNVQKGTISEDLILFRDDWGGSTSFEIDGAPLGDDDETEGLTTTQQEGLLEIAVTNGYYILKIEEGETIQSAIANSNNKARNAVIDMAWDLWRELTPQEEKNDLRYSFFIIQTKLSSEQFLASAKAKLAQVKGASYAIQELLSDCLVFKAFALGTSKEELEEIILTGAGDGTTNFEDLEDRIEDLGSNISQGLGAFFLGGPFGQAVGDAIGAFFGFGGDSVPDIDPYTYIEIDPHPSDDEIIEFLNEQNELSLNNDENVLFTTRKMTSGGAIALSILGFETDEIKQTYFDERYPDIGGNLVIGGPGSGYSGPFGGANFPERTRTNAYSIYEVFRQDDYFIWIYGGDDDPNIIGQVSTLFCQHNGIFGTGATDGSDIGGFGGLDHVSHSECVKGSWSKATELDYDLIFAGI